ncbi:hypothetical protein [uncultured Desulfovibrio sp.]|uniref:hypothetical protein n=1 Tax=uncultured Desulfovibrio sp. TaxID=167968 RepID=UPI0026337165|nr:hypothetical protein [uncultured Desulfovibrio sp.]
MKSEVDGLRARILERHASVHAFCRAHPELKRATVYLVLSGRYPGNADRQAAKIRAALAEEREPHTGATDGYVPRRVEREAVVETLREIRCAHCRRLDRRECVACRQQTEREGDELFSRLFDRRSEDEIANTGNRDADP